MNYLIPPQPIDDNNPNSIAWTDWYTKVRYAMNQSGLNWSSVTNVPANLVGLATPSTNGIYVRTGSGTAATRSIATASSSRITVSNGDGVAGNPTLDLATVTPGAGGSFLKFSVDSYGRISDTAAVTTSDLTGVLSTLTVNNSGTGDASGMTFNGSAAKTISYNTIGALPLTGGTLTGALTINSTANILTLGTSIARGGGSNYMKFADPSGESGFVGFGGTNNDFYIANELAGEMMFYLNGSTRLQISSNGVISIAAPSSGITLSVLGISGNNVITWGDGTRTGGLQVASSTLYVGANTNHDLVLHTNNTDRIRITSGGSVKFISISTTASAANAYLDSSDNNNLLRSTSSRRYKTNIQNIIHSNVLSLRPITYNSLAEADDKDKEWVGLIAEEVHEVDPRLVHYTDGKPDGVQYDRIAVLLLNEVKRLRTEMNQVKALH